MSSSQVFSAGENKNGEIPTRFRILSHVMDEAFTLPGGKKIGWDGVIGLIPGFGDIAGTIISSYMIFFAIRQGVSKIVILRMLYNVCLEMVIGFIPVLGDVFDFFYKTNTRNYQLLEQHYKNPDGVRTATWGWVAFFSLVILAIWIVSIWLFVALVQLVISLF